MTKEELEERLTKPREGSISQFEPFYRITPKELQELNEEYHKARVGEVTYQIIDKQFSVGKMESGFELQNRHKRMGAKWLKEQLLKENK